MEHDLNLVDPMNRLEEGKLVSQMQKAGTAVVVEEVVPEFP